MSIHILVIDNDPLVLQAIKMELECEQFSISDFDRPSLALSEVKKNPYKFDFAIIDYQMEEMTGDQVAFHIRKINPKIKTMILSATIQRSVFNDCFSMGVDLFLEKGRKLEALGTLVRSEVEKMRQGASTEDSEERNQKLIADVLQMIGGSSELATIAENVKSFSPFNDTVLIRGESGCGKEGIAEAIHRNSPHSKGPLIKINCGAISENLLESELFGHVKGAFTGAVRDKVGKFELAKGGSIFLDEIGEMSPSTQVKLLRVLQEKEIDPVGSDRKNSIKVDVRIIAATNKDLEKAVLEKEFREDLYYRLKVLLIEISPLRERKSDIQFLADHFLSKKIQESSIEKRFSPTFLSNLMAYNWPGNVRELENVINRSFVCSKTEIISGEAFPIQKNGSEEDFDDIPTYQQFRESSQKKEKKYYLGAIDKAGNVKKASELIGMSRSTLRRNLEKLKHL